MPSDHGGIGRRRFLFNYAAIKLRPLNINIPIWNLPPNLLLILPGAALLSTSSTFFTLTLQSLGISQLI